ncbi:MAG: glycosyltransferase family 2 protein [Candidatus Aenigmarchaeota archaeon]|nr:glycosyltransferase family 2 protein [Candidatus Aenigmarchaeota archaeon]
MTEKAITVVIPAYNEEKSVASVVNRAKKYGSVVVIDDASKDRTAEQAKKAGASVLKHKINGGLGASLRTGFRKALEMQSDVVITLDADGQHDPDDIPEMLEKISEGCDFVIGQRNLKKYPFVKKFGNFFLNAATNFVAGTSLKDTESGFRAIRTGALRKMSFKAKRYEIAVDIVYEVGRNKLKTASVPVKSPVYVKGVGVWDGVRNFIYLLKRKAGFI